MTNEDRKFGQNYRLSRAIVRLRNFTVAELQEMTGVPENTIYSFVSRMMDRDGFLEAEGLKNARPGRPRNRYSLTERGLEYLLRRNALLVSLLRGEQAPQSSGAPVTPAVAVAPA